MIIYETLTGRLYVGGVYEGVCYSGHGLGLNNPDLEREVAIGPIPAGEWHIGPAHTSPALGPIVMDLTPVGHDAHGRTLFRIHGDNSAGNKSASHGCIVANRLIREAIVKSGSTQLVVRAHG